MSSHIHWVVLSDGARPTEDIYFHESAAPALNYQGVLTERCPVSRSFGAARLHGRSFKHRFAGVNLLLCRSLPLSWLRWLERNRNAFGYIVYLIDDDIAAAAVDTTLPSAYRKRMAGIASLQPAYWPWPMRWWHAATNWQATLRRATPRFQCLHRRCWRHCRGRSTYRLPLLQKRRGR